MAEDFADRFEHYEDMTNRLIAMMANQDRINERLIASIDLMAGSMQRQDGLNERLTAAIERIEVTLARIETTLARLPRGGENGREA